MFCLNSGLEFYRGNCRRGRTKCRGSFNFLSYSIIFKLFTVHYYFDTWIQMLIKSSVNYYFSLGFLRKKTLKKYVNMFLACQQSKVTIKLNFYYCNLKKCRGNWQNCRRQLLRSTAIFNAIAVDWFQGIRGLLEFRLEHNKHRVGSLVPLYIKFFLWPDEE
jgi:hypothetical protein